MKKLSANEKREIKNLKAAKRLINDAIKKLGTIGKYDSVVFGEMIHAPISIDEIVKMIRTTNLY